MKIMGIERLPRNNDSRGIFIPIALYLLFLFLGIVMDVRSQQAGLQSETVEMLQQLPIRNNAVGK